MDSVVAWVGSVFPDWPDTGDDGKVSTPVCALLQPAAACQKTGNSAAKDHQLNIGQKPGILGVEL